MKHSVANRKKGDEVRAGRAHVIWMAYHSWLVNKELQK